MEVGAHMSKELSTKDRKKLSKKQFALPGKRKYPIPDKAHARNEDLLSFLRSLVLQILCHGSAGTRINRPANAAADSGPHGAGRCQAAAVSSCSMLPLTLARSAASTRLLRDPDKPGTRRLWQQPAH